MKEIQFITNLNSYLADGIVWQSWDWWFLAFKFCKIGYEAVWYDGLHETWYFGIGTLHKTWDTNYHEKHAYKTLDTNN